MQAQQSAETSMYPLPSYLRPYSGYPPYGVGYPIASQFYPNVAPPQYPFCNTAVANNPTPSGSSSNPSDSGEENPVAENQDAQQNIFRPIDFEHCNSEKGSDPLLLPRTNTYLPPTPSSFDSPQHCNGGGSSGSTESSRSSSAEGVTVSVLDKDLWDSFNSVGNEMIVTKPGRRLFPALLVSIRGLHPTLDYSISLRIHAADSYRYKFLNSYWSAVGESEILQNESRQIFRHPNSPHPGEFWMKKPVSFKTIKITHNPASKSGNVLLHTMHKYVMEVMIETDGQTPIVIKLPETTFIAVTSYQNSMLTQLKIDNNPFAKGFRDRENATCLFPRPYLLPPFLARSLWEGPPLSCPSPASPANSPSSITSLIGTPGPAPTMPCPFPWTLPPLTASRTSPTPPPVRAAASNLPSTNGYAADSSDIAEDF